MTEERGRRREMREERGGRRTEREGEGGKVPALPRENKNPT